MKKWLIAGWLCILATAIAGLFWYNEWKYSLPTPVPVNYVPVYAGNYVDVSFGDFKNNKPVFLHFFNPDCPCSKFNVPQFQSLVKQYGRQANFAVVIMSGKHFTTHQIQQKLNLDIPVFFDSAIAANCGVYATPQAAIIDANGKLFYRGNYNRSRYCSDEKTGYAKIALTSLLNQQSLQNFSQYAFKAYGCELPKCTK
jgi:thiol-disulfide isomerase/thioredoxin